MPLNISLLIIYGVLESEDFAVSNSLLKFQCFSVSCWCKCVLLKINSLPSQTGEKEWFSNSPVFIHKTT